jgi:hypothetical protein
MGLDAVVYKSIRNFPLVDAPHGAAVRLDEATGEIYSDGDNAIVWRREDVIASRKRLGNLSLIGALRTEVECALKHDHSSLLLNKVLYDGTHSGDTIELRQLDLLKQDLSLLKKRATPPSPELSQFISDMEELITVAKQNDNPIVFV